LPITGNNGIPCDYPAVMPMLSATILTELLDWLVTRPVGITQQRRQVAETPRDRGLQRGRKVIPRMWNRTAIGDEMRMEAISNRIASLTGSARRSKHLQER
jgi:hypothetical protein